MKRSLPETAWQSFVLSVTGAENIVECVNVQQLWSGYGQIMRCLGCCKSADSHCQARQVAHSPSPPTRVEHRSFPRPESEIIPG